MKELIILIILLMSPIALAKDSKIIKDCNPKSIESNINSKKRDIQGESLKSSYDKKHCLFVKKKIDYVKQNDCLVSAIKIQKQVENQSNRAILL